MDQLNVLGGEYLNFLSIPKEEPEDEPSQQTGLQITDARTLGTAIKSEPDTKIQDPNCAIHGDHFNTLILPLNVDPLSEATMEYQSDILQEATTTTSVNECMEETVQEATAITFPLQETTNTGTKSLLETSVEPISLETVQHPPSGTPVPLD